MEGFFGEFREQWEKVFFKRRCEISCRFIAGNKVGILVVNQFGYYSDEEGIFGYLELVILQSISVASCDSNVQKLVEESKIFQKDYDVKEMDEILIGMYDNGCGFFDIENISDIYVFDQLVYKRFEYSVVE